MSPAGVPSSDRSLRADVRLLGETLGYVLVEQEGEETLALEERIRQLARRGRAGDREATDALAATIAALPVETQAVILRAFSMYFHLANIAEQHHRVRRRREIERGGGILRESLAEALDLLAEAGVAADDLDRAARRVRVELVLTAHPTEALPRTILEKHRRLEALLERLDDPRATPLERTATTDELAEEVTILWQTDEVRSNRPRVVDEIRQGLWFVEESLWDAAAELTATWRARLAGTPLRFGSWIGGDRDGNPNVGPATVREAVERGAALARELLQREVRRLAASWGMSTTLVDADEAVASVDLPRESNATEPYRRRLTAIGSASVPTTTRMPTSSEPSSTSSRQACAGTEASASPTVGSRRSGGASTCSGSTVCPSTSGSTPARSTRTGTPYARSSARPPRSSAAGDEASSTR